MKKLLLFMTFCLASLGMFAGSGADWKNAIDFSWSTGNIQTSAGGALWYRIDLSGVASDENVLIYVTNMESTAANITARAYVVNGESIVALGDAETKSIAPNKKFAYEIPSGIIRALVSKVVYVELSSDKEVKGEAEPVEPGEKDLDCMDAVAVNLGTAINVNAGNAWYKLDMSAAMADPSKTVKLTVTNMGTATANVTAGVSFDCPSSGVTEVTRTIAAGASDGGTLPRSYLNMLADGMVYIKVTTDKKLKVLAEIVDAPVEATLDVTGSPIVLAVNTEYTYTAGTTVWYQINKADIDVRAQLAEISVTNLGTATAHADGDVVFQLTGGVPITRSETLAAGATRVEEIKRNLVESISEDVIYMRVNADQDIKFIIRMKSQFEGDGCKHSKDFIWDVDNIQNAGDTVWYAINIADAKAATPAKDIKLVVKNNGAAHTDVYGDIAFECPYTSLTSDHIGLNAGETKEFVVKNSLFASLAADELYVRITADQNLTAKAVLVDAEVLNITECASAVDFNLTTGALTTADTTWFRVDLDAVRANPKVPTLTITNNGASTQNVSVEVAFECPVTTEMQKKTETMAPGQEITFTIDKEQMASVDSTISVAYLRVAGNDIAIAVDWNYEDAGVTCDKAIEFNWVLGNEQEADKSLWYVIDLADAKACGEAVEITITNEGTAAATVTGALAFECPVTAPQTYTINLAAGASSTKTITSSVIASLVNPLYIKLTGDQKLKVTATACVAEVPASNPGCDTAIDFDWVNGHIQLAATNAEQWYRLALDTLRGDLVPQLTLENISGTDITITGELTYDCTKATMGKTITMSAGQTITKTLEKSLIAGILATYDYAYIKVTTSGDITFQSALVNNEDGRDCEHAKEFNFVDGNVQQAGDTIWYVVDLSEAKAQSKSINMGINNIDGFSGKVWAKLYFACDDATPFAETTAYNLSANAAQGPFNVAAGLIQSLAVDKVIVQLYTSQTDSIWATYGAAETSTDIDICDHNKHIKMQWNIDFPQPAGAEQWYFVDVKDIQDNTTGDAVLTITNNNPTEANLSAELAYYCSGNDKRETKSIKINAGDTYSVTATRALINNIGKEKAFLGITSDADVSFRITLADARGRDCANPYQFDWLHGTYHAADSVLWYEINLDTVKNSVDKNDLRVHVINVGTGTANAKAEVKTDCADDFLGDATATLAVGDTMKKDLGFSLLESFGWPSVFIKMTANENVKIVAELIPQAPKAQYFDTISANVCDGTIYYTMDSTEQHVINAYTTWNDTIEFRDSVNLHMADSIHTYQIHPIKMPTMIAKADLTKAPYVVCGEAISVTDITAELTTKFAAAKAAAATPDTVADVTSILWQIEDPVTHTYDSIPEDKLAFSVEAVNLKYVITTACDETAESEVFNVIADRKHEGSKSIIDTLCYGNNVYTNQQGVDVVLSGDKVWADTIVTAKSATVDTATIFNYDVKFFKPVVLPTTLNTMPTAQAGAALDLTTAENDLISQIEGGYELLTEKVDSIYFEQLIGTTFTTPSTARIEKDVTTITLRYVVEGRCNWYYDTIVVNVNPYVVVDYAAPADTLCPGDTYTDLYGHVYTVNANKSWTDTVRFDYTADQYADSVITYNLYVYTVPALPAYTTAITAQAGKAIDVTAQTAELQAAATAAATDIMSDITAYYWFIYDNGAYAPFDPAALLPTETTQVQLAYSVTTACGDSLSSAPIVVDVTAPVELHVAVVDTVCLGTAYASRLATTTISTQTSWSERVTNITVDATQLGDSIYDYTIYVYSIPTVPAATTLPIAICGQPVVVTDAQAEIDGAMAAAKTDLDSKIASAVWMINYGQGYVAFDATAKVDATIDNITMKYVVTFECGDVVESPEMPIVVEYPSAENTVDFNNLPAVSKYANRLIMIDLNAVEAQLGYKVTEDMVKWYKVVGTKDVLDANGNVDDDELVGTGYYFTITATGESLVGDYYALIVTVAGNDDPCGSTMRTTVLSCSATAPVVIAPTIAAPGETITLSNLNPDLVYIVNVFDVSGMKVDSFEISNAQNYNFQAATAAGYYMVSVENGAELTLKYIVK